MDSLGRNLSHAPVMENAPKTLSTVRCMFTTRQRGEIHNFSNSGEALSLHCDTHAHMASPGASQPCLHWQPGDTVRGGKGTQKVVSALGRWEARQELPSLLAWPALKDGKEHALVAPPPGLYDLVTSYRALQVTVKDSCWQWQTQDSPGAQLLFFPLWQLT